MKKILVIFIVIFCTNINNGIYAQNKELTIRDAAVGQWTTFYPDYLSNLQWKAKTDKYTFTERDIMYESSVSGKKNVDLLNLDDINKSLNKEGLNELKYYLKHQWIDDNTLLFENGNELFYYNVKSKKITFSITINKEAKNFDFCKENKSLAYTLENNLYIFKENKKVAPVSKEKNKGIVTGQTVHRNEFGINKGTFWSPKGNYLAFYRKDETMVKDYPLVDITKREAELENTKYPMAGMKSEEVTVGIYNIETGKINFLKTGEPKEQFLTNLSWGPDEKHMYIAVLNREQNHLKLNKYDINTGELVKTLFEEKHEKYVEPENPVMFLTNDNDKFLWQSERDNWNHVYLYNTNGDLIKQLTKGNWMVREIIGLDKAGENVVFMSTKESPLENQAYKVNIETGEITRLTKEKGTHEIIFNKVNNYFIDNYSSIEVPNAYKIIDIEGKEIKELLKAENPYKEYDLGEMTINTIKCIDEKTDLYYRLITPPDFDKNKKYPAIIYVYGGPHAQMITDSWLGGVSLWQYYMAQEGYVMLTVDNRGSANRGFEFENVIHRNLGVAEMEDQMKGVKLLKELGYIDMERIGVHGWSYGGFMTTSLMLNHNDIFKVGVAGGPVIDWKYYEIMYGERYMDMPDENPDGYKQASLLDKTDKLKGKLLIIQGYIDATVVPQHSLDFVNECIKTNTQVDFFLYPREEHNVGYRNRTHLIQKITNYFEDYLK